MRVVIAGAGAVGRAIASELLSHGHQVTLLDNMPDKMQISSVAEADWVLGDACSPDILEQAGIEKADVMVAATGDDKANLVMSLLAKSEFGVPRTVARVSHPKNEWMFTDAWGVDVPVSTPGTITALVEAAVTVGVPVKLFTFHDSGTAIYSINIPQTARVVGRQISDIELPLPVVLAGIIRDSRPLPPHPTTEIVAGDELLFLTSALSPADQETVIALFSPAYEELEDPAQED
ncbi:MAG: TrkA family potassium uptake protein [Varibaculum sp.]|nr:TrkA family potassium uptake protein [Varibaculum sp.]